MAGGYFFPFFHVVPQVNKDMPIIINLEMQLPLSAVTIFQCRVDRLNGLYLFYGKSTLV
jgi:hypothetical protein